MLRTRDDYTNEAINLI